MQRRLRPSIIGVIISPKHGFLFWKYMSYCTNTYCSFWLQMAADLLQDIPGRSKWHNYRNDRGSICLAQGKFHQSNYYLMGYICFCLLRRLSFVCVRVCVEGSVCVFLGVWALLTKWLIPFVECQCVHPSILFVGFFFRTKTKSYHTRSHLKESNLES